LIGSIILVLSPRIFANSFYNNKDLVFLSFFIISSFYAIKFINNQNLKNSFYFSIFAALSIDVRILGEEYRDKDFTGKDICRKRDIELYFNKRDHRFSSSDLRARVAKREQ